MLVTADNPDPVLEVLDWTVFDQLLPHLRQIYQDRKAIPHQVVLSKIDFQALFEGIRDTGQTVRFQGKPPNRYLRCSIGFTNILFQESPKQEAGQAAFHFQSADTVLFPISLNKLVEIHWSGAQTYTDKPRKFFRMFF